MCAILIADVMYHTVPQYILVFSMLFLFLSCNKLSDPECRCYVFDGTRQVNGTFKSPNFPKMYPPDLDCLLYRFEAKETDRVKLSFWSFDLRKPQQGRCLDYVDLFTTIDTSEESNFLQHSTQPLRYPTRPADYRICGDLSSVPQTEFYSIGSVLFLIFHSVSLLRNERPVTFGGFVGQFAFIAKDNYRTDGLAKPDTLCTYQISHLSENQSHYQRGRIFSPYYPSNYPPRANCHYHFAGANTERIILTFQSIQLNTNVLDKAVRHKPVCPEKGDLIVVTERQNQTDMTLARICGHAQGVQIVSHGPTVTVEFQSNGDLFKGQGFQASYEFVHRTQVQPSPYLSTASQFVEERQQRDHSYINPWAADDNSPKVGPIEDYWNNRSWNTFPSQSNNPALQGVHTVFSESAGIGKMGSVHSPGYPTRYPLSTFKAYKFTGRPYEHVYLKFLMLELGKRNRCTNFTKNFGDRIEIYDGPSNRSALLYEICGSENSLYDQFSHARSPELSEILSSGPDLLLTFRSDSVPGENEYGFKLLYEFRNTSAWNAKGSAVVRETNWNPSAKSQHVKKSTPRNRCTPTVGSLWVLLLPLSQLVTLHFIQRAFYVFIVEIQIQSASVQNVICIV
ncbi:hypothetical protein CRM22_010757 [Opisthorchis felineus]|uniref:CUB domain-containing protein n=1 Tax=Opisthorchis felineus TaxID=147828 RepID=A0A4S2KN54_OPIFE|nr:hypothetical protein CRM22_010757 [Opisthorchis felineus]